MKDIASVIKYEGDNRTFIWKHPTEDFNSLTQLIVHESQEAIFFMNGQALDLFGPGRHTLETQNIPKLGGFLKRATNDESPFHCEVYFINKTEQMTIKWGTDSKVEYMDPVQGFPLSIGASGEMSLRAENSRKLLLKIVGTEKTLTQARLVEIFRGFLMTKIKSYIAHVMKANQISIFEVDEQLGTFSRELHKLLCSDFEEYGVALERFLVTTIVKPEGDRQYERFKGLFYEQVLAVREAELQQRLNIINAQTEAQKTVIASQAMATKRAQEGYTYQQERGFDVMGKVAENEGSGSDLRNAAMGIGMGFGVGGAFGNTINNIAGNTMSGLMDPVPNAMSSMNNVNSTNNVGAFSGNVPGMINLKTDSSDNIDNTAVDSMDSFKAKVDKLVMMQQAGLLTDEEFARQKQRLLDEL